MKEENILFLKRGVIMPKYKVEIVETLVEIVEVDAIDEIEALEKVRKDYYDGAIVLTSDNWCDSEFNIWENK